MRGQVILLVLFASLLLLWSCLFAVQEGQAALVIISVIVAVVLAGAYLSPLLFRFVHMAKLREIHTATALLVVFGIAYLMVLIGLSPALGAFLGGVVLASEVLRDLPVMHP